LKIYQNFEIWYTYIPVGNTDADWLYSRYQILMLLDSGDTSFVTSQYDVIFTFPNQRFGEVF